MASVAKKGLVGDWFGQGEDAEPKGDLGDLQLIYGNMVAGVLPIGSDVDPVDTLLLRLEDLFHKPQTHHIMSVVDGSCYYIAVPSWVLGSQLTFFTPLAAALPGQKDHQGDGVYSLRIANTMAAAIKQGSRLRFFYANEEDMEAMLAGEEFGQLERFSVQDQLGAPLRSEQWAYRTLVSAASGWIVKAGIAISTISACIYVACTVAVGVVKGLEPTKLEAIRVEVAKLINAIPLDQPLSKQTERLTEISASVVSNGGWLDGYKYDTASGERFTLSMPSWIGRDVYEKFGESVQVVPQPEGNEVWVVKPGIGGVTLKEVGPQESVAVQSQSGR